MMNELQIFKSDEFGEVRTLNIDGEPWFVGKDVASILGYTNPQKAIRDHVDEEDKGVNEMDTPGGIQNPIIINESGLYSLILSSKLPQAKAFKRWVTSEVLPAIRKQGSYSLGVPTNFRDALYLAYQQQVTIEALETENAIKDQQIAELQPKADYLDTILQSKSLMTITQIAKDYGMSARTMNKKLHALGVQYKQGSQWFLYAKYQDRSYTSSETISVVQSDGREKVVMNTKWTLKGRIFLYNLLKEEGVLPMLEKEIGA
jgi:hypothetical protein